MVNIMNYIRLKHRSIFSEEYLYIDCAENAADSLFNEENIKVRRGSHFISSEDNPYSINFCKVRKKDREAFKRALGKMTNKMLLLGYHDYPEFCEDVIGMLLHNLKAS